MDYRPRVAFFDVLRGVAVILVLGRHMAAPAADVSNFLKRGAELWIQTGWIGVDLSLSSAGFWYPACYSQSINGTALSMSCDFSFDAVSKFIQDSIS